VKPAFETSWEISQLVWRSHEEEHWTGATPQGRCITDQSDAESHDRELLNVMHPEDRELSMQAWHQARSLGQLEVEHRIYRASDGAYAWHHTRSLSMRQSADTTLEWLGASTDIGELKRAETALSESER
jgi:PAS domain S-box-containing protein